MGLDDVTFDKIVDGTRDVFLRIDKEYRESQRLDAAQRSARAPTRPHSPSTTNSPLSAPRGPRAAYGETHDAFKALAKQAGASPLLVATVAISNRETWKVNPGLATRFGITLDQEETFPIFHLFKKGTPTKQPIEYKGKGARPSSA